MSRLVLQDQQRELLQQEKRIANELQACLVQFEGAGVHSTTLQQVVETLDELFLLVIVGEFNAGKSACINALLHADVLEEGVIPTTDEVTIVRYGDQQHEERQGPGLLAFDYPADFLRDISLVDTPGVNAVLIEHERLTEEFVPRSDLILFITSVDRPFTQSEREFLERIRAWGKKVVFILNKIDMLRTPEALNDVMTFVRDNCKHLLGFQPEIFPVSALQAQQAREARGHDAVGLWEKSRFGALENYLFETLDQAERIRLKLSNPLGVMQRLLNETATVVEQRASLLAEDARTVSTIEEQLKLYQEDMESNFTHRLGEIENIILTMRGRGDRFFDDTIRLGRILDLIQGQRIRDEFERDVIGDSAQRIDQAVEELIDWMVEHEHRLWQDIMEYLDKRRQVSIRRDTEMIGSIGRQFDYNRRALLQSVARSASNVVKSYDQESESIELSQDLRSAVTQAAVAGASGIGLGAAVVAFVGTAAADVSGILAGMALLGLGLYIIPARRKRAKQNFDEKMQELRSKLHSAMREQFRKEMNNATLRVQDSIIPYTRFVRAEQEKVTSMQGRLKQLQSDISGVQKSIEML